ncbi:MAG: hypothetical protein RSD88_03655 [Anaerovoracaceae bacterium]
MVTIDGKTYNVVDGGSIQDAIVEAKDGDTINIQNGTYEAPISTEKYTEKSLNFIGEGEGDSDY